MNEKNTLIATFVRKDTILSFIENTKKALKISADRIFVYTMGDNDMEYLCTVSVPHGLKPSDVFERPIVVHTKNGSIFSINALNVLIDEKVNADNEEEKRSNRDVEINWDEYKSKLIMLNKGSLRITNIDKIDDKSQFFN